MTIADSFHAIEQRKCKNLESLAEHGISLAKMDEFERFLRAEGTLDRVSLVVRCIVENGELEIRTVIARKRSEWRQHNRFEPLMRKVASTLPHRTEFFILVSDTIYVSDFFQSDFVDFLKQVPLLRCDWLDGDPLSENSIIIPDFRLLAPGYRTEFNAVREAAGQIPFGDRLPIIKWRGTLSGYCYPDIYNCSQFARYHLLMQSVRHPEVVDARLTNYENFVESDAAQALKERLERLLGKPVERLRPEQFAQNRYLLATDGVTSPWKTVPLRLATGSVLLMQHQWLQYFSPGLVPWEHYVPLADDMSDIVERHEWLESNPDEAQKIAAAGCEFSNEVMHPDQVELFFAEIVRECGRLLKG